MFDLRLLSRRLPLTRNELVAILDYAYGANIKEGYMMPDLIVVIVLDKEDFEARKEHEGIEGEIYSFYIAEPVDTIVLRGDLPVNFIVHEVLKQMRVIAQYRIMGIIDYDEAEEWAKQKFMSALAYMARVA
ncbi:MAG: hypothetical protein DRN15_08320 [Thermoprotei archaeon]|nr:MAG: hypothetical protein DRN15_08320 [Thermoprotei archaeon]RLF25441.1 MAG: hypothetical protein DRM97_01730 [Thermoprotei archaeon]